MKRLIIVLILAVALAGCETSTVEQDATPHTVNLNKETADASALTDQEFVQMLSDPKRFKGRNVEYYALVFVAPERDDKGVYLQAYAEPSTTKCNRKLTCPLYKRKNLPTVE